MFSQYLIYKVLREFCKTPKQDLVLFPSKIGTPIIGGITISSTT